MNVDVADVRPSLLSWATVGVMAVTFIAFMKFILAKWPIPGVSSVFALV